MFRAKPEGGTALIGGDFQGHGTTETARFNTADENTLVLADALDAGTGGKVIFWSDERTTNYGNIYARGGLNSGNGGFVEVSGKEHLDFLAQVDLTATHGSKGTLLLDPSDIQIVSGFTPNSLSPVVWLDASDTSTITSTGGIVDQWRDKSGNSNHANGSGSTRPQTGTSTLNGNNVLTFDGSNDYLAVTDNSNLDNTTGLSIFSVVTPSIVDGSPRGIVSKRVGYGAGGNYAYSMFYYSGNRLDVDMVTENDRFASNSTFSAGNTSMFSLTYDGTLSAANRVSLYTQSVLDKTASDSNSSMPDYASNLHIGTLNAGYAQGFAGDIGEVLVYRTALSTEDRNLVEQYESAKWGVALGTSVTSFSKITEEYLEYLTQTANVSLLATNNITINNLSDNLLNLGARNLSMTATNGTISFADTNDVIRTEGGNITLTAGAGMTLGTLNTTGASGTLNGNITLNVTGTGNITARQLNTRNGALNVTTANGSLGTSGTPINTTVNTLAANVAGNVYLNETNALNITTANITGHLGVTNSGALTLGSSGAPVSIGGNTSFSSGSNDVVGYGSFSGTVSGVAARIGLEATSGNFTSAGLIASGSSGWYGADDESLIVMTRAGDILGSGYTASGAANIRLEAGGPAYQNATNDINVTNVSAAQNLALYATGANAGTSVQVGGTSSVAGYVTATGVDASNNRAALSGGVDITLSSGNLTTASLWSNGGTVNLTASNGSILQNASVYSGMNGKTIRAKGSVNLTAGSGAGSYIDTGVLALGSGSNLTAQAAGKSGGNTSVNLIGRVDGNVSVTNPSNGNVTGSVNLGTDLGSITLLDDVTTVFDVGGSTTVKATGAVNLYGSFGLSSGTLAANGSSITGRFDKGTLINLNSVTASAGDIDLRAYGPTQIVGSNLSGQNIHLQAGSQWTRDKLSYVNLSSVTATGNLNVVVVGSNTGASNGNAVTITGSVGGSKSVTNESGGSARGSVSIP